MKAFQIELDTELADWVVEAAERNNVSPEELIELLIKMESGKRERSRDGREIGFRAGIYRGYDTFLIDDRAYAGIK